MTDFKSQLSVVGRTPSAEPTSAQGLLGERELAALLAHELSHVTQRHHSRLMTQQNQQTPWLIGAMVLAALAASKNPDAANAMMAGGSSSAVVIRNGTGDFVRPGRFDRVCCVAASGCADRPGPAGGACAGAAAEADGGPHGGFGLVRGGVAGRILKVAGDMKITPLRPIPCGP